LPLALASEISAISQDTQRPATYEHEARGNTHMLMMDINNLQIADWIINWMDKNAAKKTTLNSNARN
jgi:hypothetical protein